MRYWRFFSLTCAVLFLSGIARTQAEGDSSNLVVHEFWALKSTDGRSHQIEAIATGHTGDAIYVVEGVHDVLSRGATGPVDGEYLLWTLDRTGRVVNHEFIAKSPVPRPRSVAMILPLPAPAEGAIVIGLFEDEQLPENRTQVYSFLQVDRDGKIIKSTRLAGVMSAYSAAALSEDAKGVLLAGQYAFGGSVRKVDLDGNELWKRDYLSRTDMSKKVTTEKVAAGFLTIALSDDQGGFLVGGQFGKLNKFGTGEWSSWLLRCDKEGEILAETTIPGRMPSICPLGKARFAFLYDTGSALKLDGHVSAIGLDLQRQWEEAVEFSALFTDAPVICPMRSGQGFVLAGRDSDKSDDGKTAERVCRVHQYDVRGQIVSSARIPVVKRTTVQARVACGTDRAYVAIQTRGLAPNDAKEAAVFEIPLRTLE